MPPYRNHNQTMSGRRFQKRGGSLPRREGAALVLAVALMFVLFSFLAFSIDAGFLAQSKAEMQRTADAAALAGAWELHDKLADGYEVDEAYPAIRVVAASYALQNPVNNSGPALDSGESSSDIETGFLPTVSSKIMTEDSENPFHAVRAVVSKTADKNGEVPLFFGRIFGRTGQALQVEATATLSHNISGFYLPPGSQATLKLLPFALDEETWQDCLDEATFDNYDFEEGNGEVYSGGDGVWEVNLFPQGTGSPGNRGTVDIGSSNNSTNDIKRQILHGISEQDLIDLGKPLNLSDSGTMTLNGDTGISAAVKSQLNSIIGETRVIPIFSTVSGNGNNASYTIVKWVGIRIMYVKLTGAMSKKRLIVQPAHVTSPYTISGTVGSDASDFLLSPVKLAQ